MANAELARRRHRLRLTKVSNPKEIQARRLLNQALSKLEPSIALAFAEAARSILNQPDLINQLITSIDAGDLTGVEQILGNDKLERALRGQGINPRSTSFQAEMIAALQEGGKAGALQMGEKLAMAVGSLDITNPESIVYLNQNLPVLIREISEESRMAVQEALLRGFNEGRPAAQIAREVRDSVGLTQAQANAVHNFRRSIESGKRVGATISSRRLSAADQAMAQSLFNQTAAGKPPSQSRIDDIVGRYQMSLINRRAKNIARTEATRAFGAGKRSLWDQAVRDGFMDPNKVTRHWVITPDERLREDHAPIPSMNKNGVGLNEPFQTPIGPVSAPRESGVASFDVNCRCDLYLEFHD